MPTESEIISRVRRRARVSGRVVLGIGDDAAVIETAPDANLLACCDLMIEGVHFRLDWSTPRLLGHKALAVTLSDIAAMGGRARFAMVSIALPPATSSDFVDEMLAGILELANRYEVSIVGGDTSASPGPVFIDTSVIGECEEGRFVSRGGAKPGERIYVSGELGSSAVGLRLLQMGIRVTADTGGGTRECLLKHLSPEPRLVLGEAIGRAGIATAMIDISDGLSTDLSHILEASGCGAVIRVADLPTAGCLGSLASTDSGIDPLNLVLHGGEEYELLFTSAATPAEVSDLATSLGVTVTEIGETTAASGLHVERNGVTELLEPGGFQHLAE
jgi:thiamine-monophosphate kinase